MGETLSPSPNGARTFDKDEKTWVTYSGYTDDLSADLGAFGGRLEPSNYRERSLGSVGVAPRPLIADLMSRVRSPQAIGHTVRDSLWSSMRICVSSLQIAVFFQTFRMNS